jgi:cold shock CspA family protein
MSRKTRTIGLLIIFLSLAVVGAISLLRGASILFLTLGYTGALGAGVILGVMMMPKPTRIQRKSAPEPKSGRNSKRRPAGNGRSGADKKTASRPKPSKSNGGPRVTGTVKWFSDRKGFGFITPEAGGEDCFVHRSALKGGSVAEGKTVEFQIIDDDKGRRAAADVKVL